MKQYFSYDSVDKSTMTASAGVGEIFICFWKEV